MNLFLLFYFQSKKKHNNVKTDKDVKKELPEKNVTQSDNQQINSYSWSSIFVPPPIIQEIQELGFTHPSDIQVKIVFDVDYLL